MRDVPAPASGAPALQRSVVACLASILELDPDQVPVPGAGHPAPWTVWRNWLAQRRLGLVPIAEPRTFAWPGPWIALVRSERHGELVAAVAFGSPPGLAWTPLGGSESFDAVEAGYLVAAADPAEAAGRPEPEPGPARMEGRVAAIVIAPDAEARPVAVEEAEAVAGRGLRGDRYFDGRGTFSGRHASGTDITLVEAEVLDDLAARLGGFDPASARRNVVTRGIALDSLIGRRFRVGEVECRGQRRCEPCAHLERLVPGTLRPLVHRGGLRADVLGDGVIRLGDHIAPV